MRCDLASTCGPVMAAWGAPTGWLQQHLLVSVLAVWTIVCLWGIAWAFDRWWFRRIAVLTFILNAAVLAREKSILEAIGGIVTNNVVRLVPDGTTASQAGWAILFVVLVFHCRLLEIVNSRRTLATLAVDKVVDESGAWQAGLESVLRDAINRASPHSPSRYPGGGVEYLGGSEGFASSGSEPSWWVAKLGVWALRSAFPTRTLKVSGALVPAKPEHGEPAGITVTVEEARTRSVVFTRTMRAVNLQDAVEQAGYRVADFAMRRCPTLPGWASWNEGNDSSTFLEYWRGVRERKLSTKSLEAAERDLRAAAGQSPSSALPRLQLAAVLEAQRRYVDAIEMCASVASRYPLLFDARYRLALLLRKVGYRSNATPDEQRRLAQVLKSPIRGLPPASGKRLGAYDGSAAAWSDRVYDLSCRLHEQLARDFSFWRIAWCCLRSTAERRYLAPRYLCVWQRRRAARAAMQTAECCTRLVREVPGHPGSGVSPQELRAMQAIEQDALSALTERRHERRRVERGWWGIPHYNLACFYALWLGTSTSTDEALREEAVDKAILHLELAELDPHGPFSPGSLGWWTLGDDALEADAFKALRGHEKFKSWRTRAFAAAAPADTRPRSTPEDGPAASTVRARCGSQRRDGSLR